MLEGTDEEWNYAGNNKSVTYVNLSPGKYTFRVKASNNDGLWNETGTAIEIEILPPFLVVDTGTARLFCTRYILDLFVGIVLHQEKQDKAAETS